MQNTVTFKASARYGFGGKQYIARITGRDPKYTFAREFVGTKTGKRREDAEYMTDEPGLYVECDLDSKGRKTETYYIAHNLPDYGFTRKAIDKEKAMEIAKRMDKSPIDWDHEGLQIRLDSHVQENQEENVDMKISYLGIPIGFIKRADLVDIIRKALENPQ